MEKDLLDDLELDGPITLRILNGIAWDFTQAKWWVWWKTVKCNLARGGRAGGLLLNWHVDQNVEWENTTFLALLRLFYALEWTK